MPSRHKLQILAAGAIALGTSFAAQADADQRRRRGQLHRAAKEIAAAFKEQTGHEAVLSFGSTGQLYTQITQGAPFQVFLSADDERPKARDRGGLRRSGQPFTYAIGKLVLWSQDPDLVQGEETLKAASSTRSRSPTRQAAPYGAAAVETMKSLGVYDALQPKIVQGNNIGQTFQFVETGNAELGFVALSQVAGNEAGSRWIVPARPARRRSARTRCC